MTHTDRGNQAGPRRSFGSNRDGTTYVLGALGEVQFVFIDGRKQFAPNEFLATLHQSSEINEIRNRDYQAAIKKIFSEDV